MRDNQARRGCRSEIHGSLCSYVVPIFKKLNPSLTRTTIYRLYKINFYQKPITINGLLLLLKPVFHMIAHIVLISSASRLPKALLIEHIADLPQILRQSKHSRNSRTQPTNVGAFANVIEARWRAFRAVSKPRCLVNNHTSEQVTVFENRITFLIKPTTKR